MRKVSVILLRTKTKTHHQKFEATQRYVPLGFLYLSKAADSKLGQPGAITVIVEPCSAVVATDIPDTAPLAVNKEHDHAPETATPPR